MLEVLILDTKYQNPNHYIVLNIIKAVQQFGRAKYVDYKTAVREAQVRHFDIFLALDGEGINVDVVSRVAALAKTSVLWTWDDPYEHRATAPLSHLFDFIFTNDPGSVEFYAGNVHHLPLAASEFIPVRENDLEYSYDLSFVGTAWPNRVKFIRRLLRELPSLRSRFVLNYNEYIPKYLLDMPESSYIGSVSHEDFLDIANKSRVNLTLARDFSGDGLTPKSECPGPRLFETGLAGGFQLVDRETPVDRYFRSGKEVETFADVGECRDKILAALARPEQRIAVARAAQSRARVDHTYTHRFEFILGVVGSNSTGRGKGRGLAAPQPRHRILFVTHNMVAAGHFGGVEVYQETVADQLRARFDIFYYRPDNPPVEGGVRRYVLTDARQNRLQTYSVPEFDIKATLTNAPAEENIGDILREYKIDLVHFHHLINHCPSLPLICQMLGVPTVYTLQDFWMVCTRYNLLDHHGRYCNIAQRPDSVCDVCLSSAEGVTPGAQRYRRSFLSQVLGSFDRILANSPSSAAICRGIYPELPQQQFIDLGLPLPRSLYRSAAATPTGAKQTEAPALRVVFLGNFTRVKGADTFLEAAKLLADENISFTVCGRIDEPYPETLRRAELQNVIVEGSFLPGKIDLSRFDISLHLSIWPETYCITLSESWSAGIVPVVSDCGALADRVIDGQTGYLVPVDGSGELVSLLRRLEGNREELADIHRNVSDRLWLTPEQHCAVLSNVYSGLIKAYPQVHRPSASCPVRGLPSTLALTGRMPLAADWTKPDAGAIPAMPGVELESQPSRWRLLKAIKRAFVTGQVDPAPPLSWYIDDFGTGARPLKSWSETQEVGAGRPSPQLRGWVEHAQSFPSELLFAARSTRGDIVPCPVYLHDRPDLHESRSPAQVAVGFLTAPFPCEQILDEGVYGLELMLFRNDGVLEVTALPAAIMAGRRYDLVVTPRSELVRTPLPGEAWKSIPRDVSSRLIGEFTDWIEIADVAPKGDPPILVLRIEGWIIFAHEGIGTPPAALQLTGPESFYIALDPVSRPDVLEKHQIKTSARCGYAGSVWLRDLPPAVYRMEIVKNLPTGTVHHVIGELRLGAASSRSEVALNNFPSSSELMAG